LRPIPLPGLNSAFMISSRRGELATFHAAESVNEAPKPTIDW
jgi:hypothetical protein